MSKKLFAFVFAAFLFGVAAPRFAAAQGYGSYDRTQGDLPPRGDEATRGGSPYGGNISIPPGGIPSPSGTLPRNWAKLSPKEAAKIYLKEGEYFLKSEPPQYDRAVSALRLATVNNPRSEKAFLLLGLACNRVALFGEAAAAYGEALKLDEKSGDALVGLGAANFNLKNFDRAADYYQKAVALDAKNFVAEIMLANCFFMRKNFEQSAKIYAAAAALDPKSVEARYNLILSLIKLDKLGEAAAQNAALAALDKEKSDAVKSLLDKRAPAQNK